MPYNRIERRVAMLLDSLPGLRRVAKAGYQRVNYLLQGGRHENMRLHPGAAIERIPDVPHGADERIEPHECFFGYFGVSPWNRAGDRYLFHRWHKRRTSVEICVYDRQSSASRVIAASSAWSFQQGSMAQWLNANDGGESIIFNDYVDRQLACRIVRPDGREGTIPWPIQTVHPEGSEALSLNYRRLSLIQPEYVYGLDAANFTADQPLDRDGIWRIDLRSTDSRLAVSLYELTMHSPRPEMRDAGHAVNHAVYSPSGSRVAFMHRWRSSLGLFSRLYCASPDGSNLRLLLDHRMVSHYAWRDDSTLIVWARTAENGDRYYLLDVATGDLEVCCAGTLDQFGDGHPSFSPDSEWLVTDTYPDRGRMRRLLLCCPAQARVVEVGAFFSPWRYDGAGRCDLHPRWDSSGRVISIDSAHEGLRKTYAIDVGRVLAGSGNR